MDGGKLFVVTDGDLVSGVKLDEFGSHEPQVARLKPAGPKTSGTNNSIPYASPPESARSQPSRPTVYTVRGIPWASRRLAPHPLLALVLPDTQAIRRGGA